MRAPSLAGILLVAAALAPAPAARGSGASFDCAKARAWAEREVCGVPALADLDGRAGAGYARLTQQRSAEELARLRAERAAFFRERDACRTAPDPHACLTSVYEARIEAIRLELFTPRAE